MTGSSADKPTGTSLKSMLERIDSDAEYGGPPPLSSDVDPSELLRGVRERIGGTGGESQRIQDRVQQEQPPFEEPHTSEIAEEKEPPRTIRMSSGFNVASLSPTKNTEQSSQSDPAVDEDSLGEPDERAQNLGLSGGRLALVLPKRTSSRVWLGVLASGVVLAGSAYLALLQDVKIPSWPWDGVFVQGGSVPLSGPKVATRSVETVEVREDSNVRAGSLPVVAATGRENGAVGVEEAAKADAPSATGTQDMREVGEKGSDQNVEAGSRQVAAVEKPGIVSEPQDAGEKSDVTAAGQVKEPDVVLVQPGDQIAIPVKLDPVHAPPDVAALMLSGFASGFDVKNATATGAGTFVMLPQSLSDARVVVPSGAVGDTLVRVDMFNSGGARVAQTQFRMRVEPVMAIRTEADGIVQELMDRGMKLMKSGDIAAARLMFKRALESGHAPGALALGETYDPERLALAGVIGMRGDRAQAVYWYRRASTDGDARARYRLETLQAMKP